MGHVSWDFQESLRLLWAPILIPAEFTLGKNLKESKKKQHSQCVFLNLDSLRSAVASWPEIWWQLVAFWEFEQKFSYVFSSAFNAAYSFSSLLTPTNPGQRKECILAKGNARLPGEMIQRWKELCNCGNLFWFHVCVCTALKSWPEAQLKVQQMTHSRPTCSCPCRSLWAASCSVSPAVHPGLQRQTNGVLNSYTSCVLQSTRSDGLCFFFIYTNAKKRINFPWFLPRNPAEETQVAHDQPTNFFLLFSWKVGLTLTVGRTVLMMLKGSLKGGCQRGLIWRVSSAVKGQFKLFLKKHKWICKKLTCTEDKPQATSSVHSCSHQEVTTKKLLGHSVLHLCLV